MRIAESMLHVTLRLDRIIFESLGKRLSRADIVWLIDGRAPEKGIPRVDLVVHAERRDREVELAQRSVDEVPAPGRHCLAVDKGSPDPGPPGRCGSAESDCWETASFVSGSTIGRARGAEIARALLAVSAPALYWWSPFRWRCHSQLNMKNVLSLPLYSFGMKTGPLKKNPNWLRLFGADLPVISKKLRASSLSLRRNSNSGAVQFVRAAPRNHVNERPGVAAELGGGAGSQNPELAHGFE